MNEETASTQYSEFSDHSPSVSALPLVGHRTNPRKRPTLLTRLSRTMSQVFEAPAPPGSSLAPPGSPHEDTDDVDDPEPQATLRTRSSGSHPSASKLPPLVQRLKISLVLENSGSVARDHLAAERTFLAYVRTSLVIASTGVALVQLFTIASNATTDNKLSFIPTTRRIQAWARPLGATMVVFGIVVLALGTIRYFRIQSALTKGMFPVARFTAASITFVLGAVVVVVFAILVAGRN